MANNSQWKSFQQAGQLDTSSLFDFKSMNNLQQQQVAQQPIQNNFHSGLSGGLGGLNMGGGANGGGSGNPATVKDFMKDYHQQDKPFNTGMSQYNNTSLNNISSLYQHKSAMNNDVFSSLSSASSNLGTPITSGSVPQQQSQSSLFNNIFNSNGNNNISSSGNNNSIFPTIGVFSANANNNSSSSGMSNGLDGIHGNNMHNGRISGMNSSGLSGMNSSGLSGMNNYSGNGGISRMGTFNPGVNRMDNNMMSSNYMSRLDKMEKIKMLNSMTADGGNSVAAKGFVKDYRQSTQQQDKLDNSSRMNNMASNYLSKYDKVGRMDSIMTTNMDSMNTGENDNVLNLFNGFGGEPIVNTHPNNHQNTSHSSSNNSSSNYNSNDPNNQGTRETGIIEKLLHSYGFIQCCERQARLFFHFSQFSGTIEHLKIGDPVEFEMTYDRRTGKPIASSVSKIAPEVVLSEERVTGTVTTEIRAEGATTGDTQGRISYENRGECFFLPYTKDDVEGNVTLRTGDKVSFQIATNSRGNLGASHVRLENPAHPVKYQGVVCSMKESFGFIERADVVKEIFFHFSEKTLEEQSLQLGDDVEFNIQTRNGKEIAVNLTLLPSGSVVFEDVAQDIVKGQVLKPLEKNVPRHPNTDPLPGRIRYRAPDHSEVEIPFGEKDQRADFTLRHGDWVQFQIATDRRDQLQRATKISLLHESFYVSGERREQGLVASLKPKEGYGFIRSAEREPRVLFSFGEVLDVNDKEIELNDEVEFTPLLDNLNSFSASTTRGGQPTAVRIIRLSSGTVQFECITERNVMGFVTKEASFVWNNRSPTNMSPTSDKPPESGIIAYNNVDGAFTKTIIYLTKDCDPNRIPSLGDKVEFTICQFKSNKQLVAIEVKKYEPPAPTTPVATVAPIVQQLFAQQQQQQANNNQVVEKVNTTATTPNNNSNGVTSSNTNGGASARAMSPTGTGSTASTINGYVTGSLAQGFIAALKDGFGFIETDKHDREVFFHFGNFEGDVNSLELGVEVDYTIGSRTSSGGSCLSAENVRPLSKGSIKNQGQLINDNIYEGMVLRPLRSVNPDQAQYSGLVKEGTPDDEKGLEYEFGIMSLVNKKDLLQIGDPVQFQVDTSNRAINVMPVRPTLKSTVNAIKGQFGFLNYEVEEGKKLFFHTSEVKEGTNLNPGDQVEFYLVTNQRTGKSSACNVFRINDTQVRPDRLISKLRTTSMEEGGPKMTVTRQPKGPDGSRGFKISRTKHTPGVVVG